MSASPYFPLWIDDDSDCTEAERRIEVVLGLIQQLHNSTAADPKNQWVVDQIVRACTGKDYDKWVEWYESDDDGDKVWDWPTGKSPYTL